MTRIEAMPPEITQQIEAALYAGKTVAAVKLYHDSAGVGLAEAKAVIERLESDLRRQFPERFASVVKIPQQMSCLLLLANLSMGSLGIALLWAGYTRNTALEHRIQPLFGTALLVMSAGYTCVFSLQPKKRILSWIFLGLTIFLALSMMLRHHT